MLDYEKLGAFYLGKRHDTEADERTDDLVLYDAKDLNTHAVIIGMTGSGKTGLGIGILEEAAMDNIPVIAIDPKGDLGNLMLTFPKFDADSFKPWINTRAASDKGQTPDEYAKGQAALWKKGLAGSGQDGARIKKFREKTDVNIYTPGSNAGQPVSVLQSFTAPKRVLMEDGDLYRERVQATATSILSLLGIDADPITSREHILISQILDHAWQDGRDLDIAALIAAIQTPPINRVGVMDIESFYPSKDRFGLAMRLNNLLGAPGFSVWMEGEALDSGRLLYTEEGKPRISVMSIAHLDENERMFFVAMLLNDLIAWMRAQQGTSSLRAILYMDEIFGYMPPVANPPTKRLLLTLLKQARAYGLGLVLSTQNPVDLDYKGLSNTGTWFIGRLQTERDKARVMEGLEGANQGGAFDRQRMERTLAGLGKRRFLLHNVHEEDTVVFNTRWVMSYLAGPLTRDQIKILMADRKSAVTDAGASPASKPAATGGDAPVMAPSIRQFYLPAAGEGLQYFPRLVAASDMTFSNARYDVNDRQEQLFTVEFEDGPVAVDWDNAETLDLLPDNLVSDGEASGTYAELPAVAANEKKYTGWSREFKRWLRQNQTITLYRSKKYKLTSTAGETEGDFRIRLQQLANERRDVAVGKLRKRYATKATTLENRLMRAQQAIEREQQQSSKKKIDTAISFGTAILGAVLGRKKFTSASASKMGTAIRSASGARKEAGDVARAKATAKKVRDDLTTLENNLQQEVDALDDAYDAQTEELKEVEVKAKATDISVPLIGLLWMPYRDKGDGRLDSAW
ncbi:MAG: ATP-binding protein [Woeseiaceae bacterium]